MDMRVERSGTGNANGEIDGHHEGWSKLELDWVGKKRAQ